MTSRKVLRRKIHSLEFSKERWSIMSKKDFACHVEINFKQSLHVQTTATQTDSVFTCSVVWSKWCKAKLRIRSPCGLLCQFYQLWRARCYRKCGSLIEKFIENRTIHKVRISLSSHRSFWFQLLKLCEMLFQKANAVDVESRDSGSLYEIILFLGGSALNSLMQENRAVSQLNCNQVQVHKRKKWKNKRKGKDAMIKRSEVYSALIFCFWIVSINDDLLM